MSHTKTTNEKYYRLRKRDESALLAFEKIRDIGEQSTKGFPQTVLSLMKEYFSEEIKKKVRPPLSKCRKFLQTYKIQMKKDKQVQDKVYNMSTKQ